MKSAKAGVGGKSLKGGWPGSWRVSGQRISTHSRWPHCAEESKAKDR